MPTVMRGRADYYSPGDWNIACSMCGRKRKASELERNWQGLWRCPEHNEPRQPQDFVRNVKDIETVPFAQLETTSFVQFSTTFPLQLLPNPVALIAGALLTEGGVPITTEGGLEIEFEGNHVNSVQAIFPPWVIAASWAWSWFSGGAGIVITSPASESTTLIAAGYPASGVLKCVVTSTLGAIATAFANVST